MVTDFAVDGPRLSAEVGSHPNLIREAKRLSHMCNSWGVKGWSQLSTRTSMLGKLKTEAEMIVADVASHGLLSRMIDVKQQDNRRRARCR